MVCRNQVCCRFIYIAVDRWRERERCTVRNCHYMIVLREESGEEGSSHGNKNRTQQLTIKI